MDSTVENQYVFNSDVLKYMGVYQILDPNTRKIYGYNIYHIASVFIGLPMVTVSIYCSFTLHNLMNDMTAIILHFGGIINFLFAIYKMYSILYHSKHIWACLEIAGLDFISNRNYNRNVFTAWQKRTVQIMYIYLCLILSPILIWFMSPYLLQNATIVYRNMDGTYSRYRMNIINLYLVMSSEMYNSNFYIFYFIEVTIYVGYLYFSIIFDIILGVMCFSLCCQLETISNRIHSLWHGPWVNKNSGM